VVKTVLAEDPNASFIRRAKQGVEEMPSADGAQGVRFTCPIGDVRHGHFLHIFHIWFENPINAEKVLADQPYARWQRTGDSLENLTLSPSILDKTPGGCGWHGWVKNGIAS